MKRGNASQNTAPVQSDIPQNTAAAQNGTPDNGGSPDYAANVKGGGSGWHDVLSPDEFLHRYYHGTRTPGALTSTLDDPINATAYKSFVQIMGREPDATELYTVAPMFHGPNGTATGGAYLANLAKQEANTPQAYQAKSGQYGGQIGQLFQSNLGRGATPDEITHYGSMIAAGQDPYQVGQAIQGTPEYQTKQDTSFRQGLKGDLLNYNQDLFNRSKGDILSDYAKRGITNSPSLDYAMTDLLGKIGSQSAGFLSGVSANQYQGNKEAARQDYMGSMDQYVNNMNYNRNLNQGNLNALTQRGWGAQDYQTQMNDYYNQMGRANQGRGTLHGYDYLNAATQAGGSAASALPFLLV